MICGYRRGVIQSWLSGTASQRPRLPDGRLAGCKELPVEAVTQLQQTHHPSASVRWWTPVNSHGHGMVWVGKDLIDHLLPSPHHGQGPLPPAQAAPSPIQPGLEPCQGGDSHSFSGQRGPGPHHPHDEEFLPCI